MGYELSDENLQHLKRKCKNGSDLLTRDHFAGLAVMHGQESQHFNAGDIKGIEVVADNMGNLKSVLLLLDPSKGPWLARLMRFVLDKPEWPIMSNSQLSRPGYQVIELNPKTLACLQYAKVLCNFTTNSDKMEKTHIKAIDEIKSIIENMGHPLTSISFEQRLANYDPSTKKSSGELKTVMIKFQLSESGRGPFPVNMGEFNTLLIPKLKQELGDNFDRLIKGHGKAVDGSAYIEFHAKELAAGVKLGASFIPSKSF